MQGTAEPAPTVRRSPEGPARPGGAAGLGRVGLSEGSAEARYCLVYYTFKPIRNKFSLTIENK